MRRPLALLVLLTACKPADQPDANNEPATKQAPVPTDQAPTPATNTTPPKPTSSHASKPAALQPTKARELRKQYLTFLNAGRDLTKAGKLDEGMAKYREAMKIEPSNPTLLGELGWAQFKANAFDDAQATTMQALRLAQDDKTKGMLLYNLGRIAEAQGENEAAIVHYQTSLERRPDNATVKARLAALLAGKALAAPPPRGLAQLASGVAELEAACKVVVTERCLDYGGTMDGDDGFYECRCEPTLQATPSGDESWGLPALTVGIGHHEVWFPVVRTGTGWIVFEEIVWAFNPGVAGIFEEVRFDPSKTEALLPGAAQPQLVLAWKKDRSDSDMGVNEYETEWEVGTLVCTREGDQAWCTKPLVSALGYTRDVEFPEAEDEEPIEHVGLPINKSYAAAFEWREGKLVVKDVETKDWALGGPGEQPFAAGEYPLTELLGK